MRNWNTKNLVNAKLQERNKNVLLQDTDNIVKLLILYETISYEVLSINKKLDNKMK